MYIFTVSIEKDFPKIQTVGESIWRKRLIWLHVN